MTPAITLEELLKWNQESSDFWKAHLEANPALLALPCGIGGAANVQQFVRHIWGVELRWGQRIAGLPVSPNEEDARWVRWMHSVRAARQGRRRSSAPCWTTRL